MKPNAPNFLNNQPIGEDKFDGQSQKNIAKSIAEILQNNICQMIGIDGGWGTGKSNLVGIVEKTMKKEDPNKYHFFTYDAWGHQGDLHRKAFLEELIIYLTINKNILKESVWKGKLKELLGKKVETKSKSIPKLGYGIIFSFLTFILLPFIGKIEGNDKMKIYVLLVPFCLILVFFIIDVLNELRKAKWKICILRKVISEAATKMIMVYKDKDIESTKVEYTHEINPSVANFRSFIQEISESMKENRIVLVFDNFDRLPVLQVKELWASIHTFFAEKNDYKNISVIIPFDREHIISAFKEEDIRPSGNNSDNNNSSKCYGNDFINKTFDVVFRVSLPVLSDWEEYFRDLWGKAFGNIDKENESEYNKVVQIYDLLTTRITPREIIAFINECVSIKMSIDEDIANRYIALFVKGKEFILKNPIEQISTPTYLGPLEVVYKSDENLPKFIAALTYQVNSKKALEVVYRKELKDALENGNVEKVKIISESKTFMLFLNLIINEILNVDKAVITLIEIPEFASNNLKNIQAIWDSLFSKEMQKTDVDINLWEYQKILVSKVSQKNKLPFLQFLLSHFAKSDKYNSLTYSKNITALRELMSQYEIDLNDLLETRRTTVVDFVQYIGNIDFNKYDKIECNSIELDAYLENLPIEQWSKIKYIPKIIPEYELPNYKSKLYSVLPSVQANSLHFKIVIDRLKEIEETIDISDITDQAISANSLDPNYILYDIIALAIARRKTFSTTYPQDFSRLLDSNDEAMIKNVAEVINYYTAYDELMIGLEGFGSYPLYKGLCQELTRSKDYRLVADIQKVLPKFAIICSCGEISPFELIEALNEWELPEIELKKVPQIIPIQLLETTLKNSNSLAIYIRHKVAEFLNSLKEDEWQVNFNNLSTYALQAALLLDFKWNTNSINALKSVLIEVASTKKPIPDKKTWNRIIFSIEKSNKSLAGSFNTVADTLCETAKSVSVNLFLFFADWLFKYSNRLLIKQEVLRKIFPSQILSSSDCVRIILDNKEIMPTIISASGDEAVDFTDAILDYARGGNTEMIDFAKYLKLEVPPKEKK